MSYLRGSANYVWCTTSVLGKGATGAVFQGVSKHDGEPVAVKTFNQLSHMRPQEVQMREFEVLKKVKHENIVKLLAIEEEQDGRGKVIVLELCAGGSLFNILDDPENTYGLPEDDFLLVLNDLCAGMKHLRDNNLVHRDLKPGNIMKFISEDGRIIYKITDFGAAKELEEEGEFMSLYGTEEYLHPDMYERAVLRKPVGKTFSASVDLWSIGVTLYHVATGNLPFRPYGGRKNKEMMYYITTKKESGVISGTQTTENGPVEWKRDMPSQCQLSSGLKILITPLLAGLMEVDSKKRWSFENFFSAVRSLLDRKRIHIFYVNRIQTLRIYMDVVDKTLANFQCLVMEQTDIPPESQVILFKDCTLHALLDNGTKCTDSIPSTTEQCPLILCHRENNNVLLEWDTKDLPSKFPTFPNLVNVENDSSLGKHACAAGNSYKRRVEKICTCVSLINMSVKTINQVIVNELIAVSREGSQVSNVIQCLRQQLSLMSHFHKTSQSFLSTLTSTSASGVSVDKTVQTKVDSMSKLCESQLTEFRSLSSHLLTLEQPIKQLFNRFVENSGIKDISRASIKAATHVTKLRDSWQHLLRDRATRSLTYNDEQFHILERIKMQEKSKCLSELLNEECQLAIVRLAEVLSDWYKTSQAAFIQTEILAKDTTNFQENLELYLLRLNEIVESYLTDLGDLSNGLKSFQNANVALQKVNSGPNSPTQVTSSSPPKNNSTQQQTITHKHHNNNSHHHHHSNTSINKKERSTHRVERLRNHSDPSSGSGGEDSSDRDLSHNSTGSTDADYPPRKSEQRSRRTSSAHSAPTSRREYVKYFNRGLKELTSVQEEVWNILKENAELVNQFQTLTLSLIDSNNTHVVAHPPTSGSGYDSQNNSGSSLNLVKNESDLSGI